MIARKISSASLATLFLLLGIQAPAWANACTDFDSRFAAFQKDKDDYESEADIIKYDNPQPRTDPVLCAAASKAHNEGRELLTLVNATPRTYVDCWGKDRFGLFTSGMTDSLKGMEGYMDVYNCGTN